MLCPKLGVTNTLHQHKYHNGPGLYLDKHKPIKAFACTTRSQEEISPTEPSLCINTSGRQCTIDSDQDSERRHCKQECRHCRYDSLNFWSAMHQKSLRLVSRYLDIM